jgi:hypothetical protein
VADDQAVTKVTVTIPGITVTIEAADPLTDVASLALDMLRDAQALDTARSGPAAAGFGSQIDQRPIGSGHARWGREMAPVRAENAAVTAQWEREKARTE